MTFSLDLKLGAANDAVKILIDGKLVRVRGKKVHRDCRGARHEHSVGANRTIHARRDDRNTTATTWEDSTAPIRSRWGVANTVPTTAKLLFRGSGNATIGNVGQAS